MSYNPNASGIPSVARASSRNSLNDSGSPLLKGTPVRATATGIDVVDVSVEAEVFLIIGIVRSDTADSLQGEVIGCGLLEDITTSIVVGSGVWLSKTGTLTDVKPSIGVGGFLVGDWVIRLGVIAKNTSNPVLKDLLINIQIIGQL